MASYPFIAGLFLLCLSSVSFQAAEGYKILMVCPALSRSHFILCSGVTDTLVNNGHEVTFISGFQGKNKKVREMVIPFQEIVKKMPMSPFSMLNMTTAEVIHKMVGMQEGLTEMLFTDEKIQKFLNDKSEKFDLVIYEYFMNHMLNGFGIHFDCPVIALSSVSLMSWLAELTSNPLSIPTVPNIFTEFTKNMTFKQRLINTLIAIAQGFMGRFFIEPSQKALYEKYMPKESQLVPYDEMKTRISMVLINSYPSMGVARPLLPNSIEIGGYHITDPEPLPADLQKTLDSAKHGVIYFSMGSVLKSSELDINVRNAILKTFSGLKETVLWKFEEDLPNKPNNVIIKNWMPQWSILAHPNVKLFISHGGLLSFTEATYFGVPLMAIPIFGDQHHNARTMVEKKQGVMLPFFHLNEETFAETLKEATENTIYGQTAKQMKDIFHDRPIKPRDLLAFYVNHVVKSKGAKHLSPPPLGWCSNMLLDVAGVLLIPIIIVDLLILFICKKLCCKRKQEPTGKTKKNN